MAATKLDGAGAAKMAALEDALGYLQKIHGIVEHWALAMQKKNNTSMFGMQLRRTATPLVGLLKPIYGLLADQVSGMILVATRGGNDAARVRSLREGVGLLRQAIEIQQSKVKAQHSVDIALTDE
ncbi:MAG TPA: hypothetical protein VFZ11_12430 [Gemmatimonadaceae bacterium]